MKSINKFFLEKIEYIFPLFLCSCLFITQITQLSPFYFGIVFSFFMYLFCFTCDTDLKIFSLSIDDFIILFFSFLLIIYVLLEGVIFNSSIKDICFIVLGYLFYFFAFSIYFVDINKYKSLFRIFIFVTLVLFLCEVVYRISHPSVLSFSVDKSNFFYMFKWNSIIFQDTNETGFLELMFFSFMLFLRREKIYVVKVKVLVLSAILIILTFSRAAMLAMFCLLFYEYFFKKLNIYNKIVFIFCIFFISLIIFIIFLNDASFLTKVDIFNKTKEYIFSSDLITFLFGNGLYNSKSVLGIYGHNYFTLYLVEFGFIGLLLFLTFILLIFLNCHKIYYILIPYFIAGLSYAPYFIPYVFFFIGNIKMFCRKKGEI